ncbi:MAG: sulfatase/phosphatase domain-containing protein, partial [Phycisphaerae bacterium]
TRVPLILRVPGGAKGHVVRRQVEAFDIVPTILELAGIQPQHVHFARPLTEQVGGEQGDPDRAVFAEGGYDSFEPRCFEGSPLRDQFATDTDNIYYPKGLQQKEHPESVCRSTMIRTLKHKLIRRSSGRHELYDLQADPQEVSNVYGQNDYQPVKGELEQQMLDWFQRTSDVTPYEEHPRGHSWDRKGA